MPQDEASQGSTSQCDPRYNSPEPAEHLDESTSAGPEAEFAGTQEAGDQFRDKSPRINLSARVPDDRINAWLEADLRFRNTWFRQRSDFPDQTQGRYDLALASFGLRAGCTEQEVIDLIVHHRALHRQKQRTGVDYFARTIAKAASRSDNLYPISANNGSADSKDSQHPGPTPTPDKATICKNLSDVLGVQIRRMTKITGQSPIFHMELAQGTAEFPNVSKLITQASVRNTLAAITGKLMRHFTPKDWQQVAQMLLDACAVEEGGEEMELQGAARLRLGQYLSATAFIDSVEGKTEDSARKPMIEGGVITVCSSDIQTFINKTTTISVTIPTVVGMLKAVEANCERYRGNFPEQSRWFLPPDKFAAADYDVSAGEELPDDSQ